MVNELYADVFQRVYGLNTIGLRYFNVFGPKQNPEGPYAAVIPLFIKSILSGKSPVINGDGSHSRDFTFVANAVQANILALDAPLNNYNTVYNVACGEQTNLNQLVKHMNEIAGCSVKPEFVKEREGDIKHSLADISKSINVLGYAPEHLIEEGLRQTISWYRNNEKRASDR